MRLLTSVWIWVVLMAPPGLAQTDILFAELYLPDEIDRWYNQGEYPRLSRLCDLGDRSTACYAREFRSKEWTLASLHASPTRNARQLGTLVAVGAYTPEHHIHIRIDYQPPKGKRVVWISNVGDWGYGLDLFVIGRRGSWLQLPPGPFPQPVWIQTQRNGLSGGAGSIVGTVIAIAQGVQGVNASTGRRTELPADRNYVIERITGGQAFVRQEVGADMPCEGAEEEKEVPTATTPRFRVLKDLFDKTGRPKVTIAYGRGC